MARKPTYEELEARLAELEARGAEAHASAEFYGKLLATLPDLVVRMDLDGTIRELNQAGLKTSGYHPSDLIGRNMLEFIAPRDRERAMQNTVRMYQAVLGPQEYHLIFKDGSEVLVEVNGDLLRDQQGDPVGIVHICRDISERVRSREALRESEERYRSLVENSHHGVIIIDDDYYLIYMNDEFCRITGYPREEVLGCDFRDYLPPETIQWISENYKMRQKGLELPRRYEFSLISKDGQVMYCETSSVVILDSQGRKQTMSQIMDITERKKARSEKESLEAQLRHAQKMEAVGVLAGGVAHDFNNILQVISGQVQLLTRFSRLDPEDTGRLNEVERAAARAAELVHRLLTFSRKVEPMFSLVDVNQELDEAAKMLERIIPKMIEISLSLDPEIGTIEADPNQLNQVLLNLGTNARDAMPQGGRLEMSTARLNVDQADCAAHPGAQPGEYVRITVADNGLGMDALTLEHVFDPFFTTKQMGQGTGLGMAMAYGIVNNHGGFITCRSQPDQGARFEVFLPTGRTRSLEPAAPQPDPDPSPGSDELILLVDDETCILDVASQVLAQHGYRIATASNGEQALDYYQRHRDQVDLVVLDLGMPGMGGLECLQRLRAITPDLKVIIASGYADLDDDQDFGPAQADAFLAKPYQLAELLVQARRVLDTSHSA